MPRQYHRRTADSPADMLTIQEFCSRNRISMRFYYVLRDRGEGPAVTKLGSRVLISQAAAEAWRQRWTARQ